MAFYFSFLIMYTIYTCQFDFRKQNQGYYLDRVYSRARKLDTLHNIALWFIKLVLESITLVLNPSPATYGVTWSEFYMLRLL